MPGINETNVQRVALAIGSDTGTPIPVSSASPLPNQLQATSTAGGLSQYRRLATADTNAAVVKASAGRVYAFNCANLTASAKFVRLYNKATAPNPATDNALIIRTIVIPPNGIASYHSNIGMAGFTAGIAVAATGAIADTDATALAVGDVMIHVDFA